MRTSPPAPVYPVMVIVFVSGELVVKAYWAWAWIDMVRISSISTRRAMQSPTVPQQDFWWILFMGHMVTELRHNTSRALKPLMQKYGGLNFDNGGWVNTADPLLKLYLFLVEWVEKHEGQWNQMRHQRISGSYNSKVELPRADLEPNNDAKWGMSLAVYMGSIWIFHERFPNFA